MKELESHCFASVTPFVSDLQTTWGDQVISTKDIIRICSTFLCPLAFSTSLSLSNQTNQEIEGKGSITEFVQCFLLWMNLSSKSFDYPMFWYLFNFPVTIALLQCSQVKTGKITVWQNKRKIHLRWAYRKVERFIGKCFLFV